MKESYEQRVNLDNMGKALCMNSAIVYSQWKTHANSYREHLRRIDILEERTRQANKDRSMSTAFVTCTIQ